MNGRRGSEPLNLQNFMGVLGEAPDLEVKGTAI